MCDVPHNALPGWQAALVVGLWAMLAIGWIVFKIPADTRRKMFFRRHWVLLVLLFGWFTLIGADKGGVTVSQVFRLLFWDPLAEVWPLAEPAREVEDAEDAINTATNLAAQAKAVIDSNEIWTISFDWHTPNRLPYHARQNVIGRNPWVRATNINDVLYEDHYVAFNSAASTNPAVVLIEYAQNTPAGIVRYSAEVITNSYPDTTVIELQSGSHTCYWFRVAVPAAFVGSVRDWNGEALFGSPEGSGKGFDLLGTIVVDDGDSIWVGATETNVIGTATNIFKNGINTTEEL